MNRRLRNVIVRAYPGLLLGLILLGLVLSGFGQVVQNTQSDALDQGAYLTIGLGVREEGRLTDPNRQPLLSWLLTPFARRDMSYFTWAKLVTLATAVLAVLGAYLIAARLSRRPAVGLCVALLVASNAYWLSETGTVMVEPLLALFLVLTWYVGLRALETDAWRYWLLGGLLTGVGYLAKESAAVWAVAATIGAAIAYRLHVRHYLKWIAFLAVALVGVCPTLIYNIRTVGVPVQTGNINTLWMDDWEQFFAVGPAAQFSMLHYFQTHSFGDVATRVYDGLVSMAMMGLSAFLPIQPVARWLGLRGMPAWFLLGVLLVGIVVAGYLFRATWSYCQQHGRIVVFTLAFFAIYVLLMAWNVPVTYDVRYVTPLLPLGYVILVIGVTYSLRHTLRERPQALSWLRRGAATLLAIAIFGWTAHAVLAFRWVDVFVNDRQVNATQTALVQELGKLARGTTVVHGPSHGLPMWLIEGPTRVTFVPSDVNWPHFTTYLESEKAQYLVMTPEVYLRRLNLFHSFLYSAWPDTKTYVPENEQPLGIRALPASWDLVLTNQGVPSAAYVFRLQGPGSGDVGAAVARGDEAVADGDWQRAESEYIAALRLAQGDTAGLERALGQLAAMRGLYDDALHHLDRAILQRPQNPWYRTLRADLLVAHGGPAAADYEIAAAAGWANAQAALGWLAEREGNAATAISHYRQALSLSTDDPWYEAHLGGALAAAGLPGEALLQYQNAARQGPSWPFLQEWLDAAHGRPTDGPVFQPITTEYTNGPTLKGYRVDASHVDRDGVIELVLRWSPSPNAASTERAYAKLINAVYGVWGEGDADLNRQGVPAGAWAQDVDLEQMIEIPVRPGTPPGSYQVTIDVQSITLDAWLQPAGDAQVKLGPIELPRLPWQSERLGLTAKRSAVLDGKAQLLGYRLEGEARPGQSLDLTLFWQAAEPMPARYTVFTHLTDAAGKLWAQKDNEPADGFYPTSGWTTGEIVRDPYRLAIPADAPPGEYVLQAGMYLPATGQRLSATGESATPQRDAILVAKVTVR